MKLIVLTNLYPPNVLGGYELLAQDIVDGLLSRGHSVTVLTSGNGQSVAGQARILRLARPFGSRARRDRVRHVLAAAHNARAMKRYLEREGVPDAALIMSLRRLGVEPLRVLQEFGVPYVVTVNDDWPVSYEVPVTHGIRGWIGRSVDRASWWRHLWRGIAVERVMYLSESTRAQVREAVRWFPEGMVCSQGVNRRLFVPRAFREIPPEPKLVFAGRLHPTKAPDVALEALAALHARGVKATLAFAGTPVTARYGAELESQSRRLGVASSVRWLGQVDRARLGEVYRAADLMLFLSRWEEPQGLTHMEAMACGVPVVAYPLGGAKELLDAHTVSARASSCTGDAVAQAVIELIGDPSRQRQLVHNGLQLVREQSSLDGYVDALARELTDAARSVGRAGMRDAGGKKLSDSPNGPPAHPDPRG